jgi:poly-beta-1,6-N-acetyl-D-glucosamine N-deacetylase
MRAGRISRTGAAASRALHAAALWCALTLWSAPAAAAQAWPTGSFALLCYHDVRDELRQRPDLYTVETRQLTQQFAWLRSQGYHVISMDEVIASRREHRPLPDRAVVLSFDDGLQSVYTRAFPLLEAFNYPAVVGLVGAWLGEPAAGEAPVTYPDDKLSRADFLRPEQIQEMRRSGLIEFASHSFAMHVGVAANPQGNLEPAAAVRLYDATRGGYEDAASYRERIRRDIAKSSDDILRLSGLRPRIIVWPYGDHNHAADRVAEELGMPTGFTLEVGLNTPDIPLSRLRRTLVTYDFTTAELARVLEETPRPEPLRALRIDLDDVYDADPARQEANLSRLLDRVKAMGINTVFLQASADPGHTGMATALYFPNRRLPMRADLFNRASWQLRTRTGVAVFARLPLLSFDLSPGDPAYGHWVSAAATEARGAVRRLSPSDPAAREAVRDIYGDLATYGTFQGVLFADDARLADLEGSSAPALSTYAQFTREIGDLLRADHDSLKTARNLSADDAGGGERAQAAAAGEALREALADYDYVVLAGSERALSKSLLRSTAALGGLARTVFELRAGELRDHVRPLDGRQLAAQLGRLRDSGARNLGYYPDDFRNGLPALEAIRPAMSRRAFPGSD